MLTSRREVSATLICLVPLIGYVVYLMGLQDDTIRLVRIFGGHIDIRAQIRILYAIGNIEIIAFGAGLAISASSYYVDGSIDRRLLAYTLASITLLILIISLGLNAYYQHMIGQLGL